MFIQDILLLHKFSSVIIFDRNPQFVSNFWKRFYKIININKRLLTAYHLQTDRLIEKINLIVKAYFRAFVEWE